MYVGMCMCLSFSPAMNLKGDSEIIICFILQQAIIKKIKNLERK